jgi:hypothetical protein
LEEDDLLRFRRPLGDGATGVELEVEDGVAAVCVVLGPLLQVLEERFVGLRRVALVVLVVSGCTGLKGTSRAPD